MGHCLGQRVVEVPSRQGRPVHGMAGRRNLAPAQEARDQLSAAVYCGNTDLERVHFSTVFVALLWRAGLPESKAGLPRPHGAQPCAGLQQETPCFHCTGPC